MTYAYLRSVHDWWEHVRDLARRVQVPPEALEHHGAPRAYPCHVETSLRWEGDLRPYLVARHTVSAPM